MTESEHGGQPIENPADIPFSKIVEETDATAELHLGNPDAVEALRIIQRKMKAISVARAAGVIETDEEADRRRSLLVLEPQMQALQDPLMGIYNRLAFGGVLDREIQTSQREGRPSTLVFLDLDDFKGVNDLYSHAHGDGVLISLARYLGDSIRANDVVARFGGEEIALLLAGVHEQEALPILERIRAGMSPFINASMREMNLPLQRGITASIGTVEINGTLDQDRLIQIADRRMYLAKNNGKNQIVDSAKEKILRPRKRPR